MNRPQAGKGRRMLDSRNLFDNVLSRLNSMLQALQDENILPPVALIRNLDKGQDDPDPGKDEDMCS